jgi:hypothetical protein
MIVDIAIDHAGTKTIALDPGDYEVKKRSPSELRFAKIHVADGEERELREARMDTERYVPLARKGSTPRAALDAGYEYGATASPQGMPLVRAGYELDRRTVTVAVRVTAGMAAWTIDRSYVMQGLTTNVRETMFGLGMTAARPWELGRFELRLGGGVDALGVVQTMYGHTNLAPAIAASGQASAAWRATLDIALTLDAEPGLLVTHEPGGVAARPYLAGFVGGRYEF